MTTFTWTVAALDRAAADGFVTTAHWRCSGAAGDLLGSMYSACSFEGEPSIPYADLTEEIVLGWVWEKVNKNEIEAAIEAQIESQRTPVIIRGIPW